jgi:hypothetical protein
MSLNYGLFNCSSRELCMNYTKKYIKNRYRRTGKEITKNSEISFVFDWTYFILITVYNLSNYMQKLCSANYTGIA